MNSVAPANSNSNNGSLKISPAVFAALVGPLCVAGVVGIAAWAWSLQAGHSEQEVHLVKHDGEIERLQQDNQQVLAKLDEILVQVRK